MYTNFKNSIDFFIRNITKFSRKNFVELNKDILLRNKKENQYIYDTLNRYFIKNSKSSLRILDIGSKNWYYAKGEHRYFKEFCANFKLDGVELDAYRLYSNFYSRAEVAKFYIKDLENTNYIAGNLLNIKDKYDYIIWILPFILIEPLEYWGLPRRYFMPKNLLKHAYSILKEDGQMLIINQGQAEATEQEKLFKALSIPYKNLGEINSEHFEYKHKRYGWLVKK